MSASLWIQYCSTSSMKRSHRDGVLRNGEEPLATHFKGSWKFSQKQVPNCFPWWPPLLYKKSVIMKKVAGGELKFWECHDLVHNKTSSHAQRTVTEKKFSENFKGFRNGNIGKKRHHTYTGKMEVKDCSISLQTRSSGSLMWESHCFTGINYDF